MTIWFTSDPHFNHSNIIQYCDRPFKHVDEMDECLIERWNERVKPSDHIYCLGDLCLVDPKHLMKIWVRLQGHKRLLFGNHDIYGIKRYLECCGFEKVGAYRVLDNILFSHIPVHPSSLGRFQANVHGHIHNNQSTDFPPVLRIDKETQKVRWVPYVNISVEVTKYRPVSFEEVKQLVTAAAGKGEK